MTVTKDHFHFVAKRKNMKMKWCYIFILILYQNIKGSITYVLKNNTNEITTKENNEKKGTIRIAGPWHSDSALDRNVDPGEDSYVKKIISSNEGLNFNKDMAEAGEMFEVNGIDDFYDKNALVTYEVNGHEIPVHLRPKYTPQSKSMFPEYIRETPAAMGLTRQAKDNNHEGNQHRPYSSQSALESISGFTSKELPEYNVHDSPILHEESNKLQKSRDVGVQGFHSIRPLPVMNIHHEVKRPWKALASEYHKLDHTSENSNLDRMIKAAYKHKYYINDVIDKPHISELIDQNHRVSEEDLKTFHHKGQNEANIEEKKLQNEVEYHKEPDRHLDFSHTSDEKTNRFSKTEERYTSDKDMSKYFPDENHHISIKDSDQSSVERFMKNPKPDEPTQNEIGKANSDTVALFAKLEDLHKSLASENDYHMADGGKPGQQEPPQEPIAEEKEKAKVRILSLLGELTKKLQGMEAVVSGNHNIDKFYDSKSDTSDLESNKNHYESEMKSESQFEPKKFYNKDLDHEREFAEKHFVGEANSVSPVDSKKLIEHVSDFSNDNHKTGRQEDRVEDHETELRVKEKEQLQSPDRQSSDTSDQTAVSDEIDKDSKNYIKSKDDRVSEFADKIHLDEEQSAEETTENLHPQRKTHQEYVNVDGVNDKILPETIEKFKDENKPFVMDTNAIDYEPVREDHSKDDDDSDDDVPREKHHKKSHKKHSYGKKEKDEEDEEITKHRHRLSDKHSRGHSLKTHSKRVSKYKEKEDEDEDGSGTAESIDKITESLATADEHDSGVARERSYRPKTDHSGDIEYPDYEDVKDGSIFETNILRKRYHANKINWSDRLSDKAQQSAEKLTRRADFSIDQAEAFKEPGENIALVKLNSLNVGKDAIDTWAREGRNYDFRSPLVTKKNSDFVQLMWKGDKEFGVGVAKSRKNDGWIVTSFYDSPYIDRFQDLKVNLQSENPIEDPYSDIVG